MSLETIENHPYAKFVRDWLFEGGLKPEELEVRKKESITWEFYTELGALLSITFYHDEETPYFAFSGTVTMLGREKTDEIMFYLLTSQRLIPMPVRYVVDKNSGAVMIQCRGPCDEFTRRYFAFIVERFPDMADNLLKEVCTKYGLKPFAQYLEDIEAA